MYYYLGHVTDSRAICKVPQGMILAGTRRPMPVRLPGRLERVLQDAVAAAGGRTRDGGATDPAGGHECHRVLVGGEQDPAALMHTRPM